MDIIFPENLLPREIFRAITPFLDEENIVLLTGARQTGKTSLLYLLIGLCGTTASPLHK